MNNMSGFSGFAEGLRIRIRYLNDKIPPLEYIGGGEV